MEESSEFDPSEFEAYKAKSSEFDPNEFEEFKRSKPSALEAGATGLLQGATANWSDEMMAASAASGLPQVVPGTTPIGAARLAWEHLTGQRGPATETYESTLKQLRERNKQLQKEHRVAYDTGEFGGAVTSMLLAPEARAATIPGRIASGVAQGTGYGALAGAGEGEGLKDTLKEAGTGALTGAGLGAVGAGAYEALAPVARQVGNVIRGVRNPDEEAARRIATHMTADWQRAGPSLTPEEIAAANAAGLPRAIIDAGDESTRALARSAANSSPEARAALQDMARDRFETQSPRVADFIRSITGGANAGADLETLQTAARQANRPAYQAAYKAGSGGVWNPEIERLVGASPSIQQAMKNAVQRGADRSALDGMGAFNPSVTFENGVLKFRRGNGIPTYPDIQFWDYTQRELRDMASAAQRSGRNEEYGALTGLRRNLLGQLDNTVPEFAQARGGAARFFGADNALEAGENFVNYKPNARNDISMRQSLGKMSQAERELFARGYASKLADSVERAGDNRNLLNSAFLNNGPARQRTLVALGPQRAAQLEALLRAEAVVDRARTALGNSTTARQLMEMGLAGGATAGAESLLEQNFNPQHLITAALMGGVLHRGAQVVDQRVARRVGEMLASSDPTVLARGVQAAARNPALLNALRYATSAGARGATELINPSVNSTFKHGGAVNTSKAKGLQAGMTAAQSRKASNYSSTRGVPSHHCGICEYFREKNSCSLVGGYIAKMGGCDWFARPRKSRADGGSVVGNSNFQDANESLGLNKQEADLYKRHLSNLWGSGGVDNPDGSRSSLYQAVQEHNGKFYNIPTVWNGKIETQTYTHPYTGQQMEVPNQTAIDNVSKEGWDKFPSYNTPEEADARYDQMHVFMEKDTQDYLTQNRAEGGRVSRASGGEVGGIKIDRNHDVKWLTVKSLDGKTIYKDRSVKRFIQNNGKQLDTDLPLIAHENAEFDEMRKQVDAFKKQHGREPNDSERRTIYLSAHKTKGTVAEEKWLRDNGFSAPQWMAWCRGELARIEKKKTQKAPTSSDVSLFPHGGEQLGTTLRASGGRIAGFADGGDTAEAPDLSTLPDPFEAAARHTRLAVQHHDLPTTGIGTEIPSLAQHFAEPIQRIATAPRDAFTGALQVSDPETGMPTPEAMSRANEFAGAVMGTSFPFAEKGALGVAGGRLERGLHEPITTRATEEGLPGPGELLGGQRQLEAPRVAAAEAGQAEEPLEGLPSKVNVPGHGSIDVGPFPTARRVAREYMEEAGLPYEPVKTYAKVDEPRARRIAQAFEDMPHDFNNPEAKASYEAMANETMAQWQHIKKSGLQVEFIPPGMPDPYAASPRLATEDIKNNNHMWVFPTDSGYGETGITKSEEAQNPMLRRTGEDISGKDARVNDIFRIVHDYFGHAKEGVGFRADGEENAWRSHAAMYSPLARKAMTTETRGQNSWLNYGPHGEANRKAKTPDTVFADQKFGLLPDWVMEEGRLDQPSVAAPAISKNLELKPGTKEFNKAAVQARKEIAEQGKGSGPLDLSSTAGIPETPQEALPRYEPARGISPRLTEALQNKEIERAINKSISAGTELGADKWYHTEPIRRAFVDILGDERGMQAFDQYMHAVAATSPRSDASTNIRNASYYLGKIMRGEPAVGNPPKPYGHVAQTQHRNLINNIIEAYKVKPLGAAAITRPDPWDLMRNPKPASFVENLRGNLEPATIDTHAFRNIGMRSGDPRFLATSVRMPSEAVPTPESQAGRFGHSIVQNKEGKSFVDYKPQQLVKEGKLTLKEAQDIPAFWESAPNANEYAAAEDLYRKLAKKRGVPTADAQAAAWSGAGKLTGLASPATHTFPQLFNERVLFTAKMRGEDPMLTLEKMIRGEAPLLSHGGAAQYRKSGGRVMPHYVDKNPTQAQKDAGNYRKAHLSIHGIPISIENTKDSLRYGVDKNDKPWSVKMPAHYGYIRGTKGEDEDHIDVYVGPHHASKKIFVINQKDADSGRFDEHKALIGCGSKEQAQNIFLKSFSDGKGKNRLGNITEMSPDEFKKFMAVETASNSKS